MTIQANTDGYMYVDGARLCMVCGKHEEDCTCDTAASEYDPEQRRCAACNIIIAPSEGELCVRCTAEAIADQW